MFCPRFRVAVIYLRSRVPYPFSSGIRVPLPNLGFSLAGFTSFHSTDFSVDFVTVALL